MSSILIIFVCALIAFSLSAVSGGGAGLILMPLLGLYVPTNQLPVSLSIGTVSSSVSRIYFFYKNIKWSVVKWFVPTAIPSVMLGAYLLKFLNPLYLEIIMGLFLVSNLPSLFSKSKIYATSPLPNILLSVIGFFAGFLSGLTGAVGLLFNRFYLRYGLSKEEILATRAANEALLHIIKLILYMFFGLLTGKVIAVGLAIAMAGLISSWVMKRGLKYISEILFRKIGYGAMVLSGFAMLTQSTILLINQNNAYIRFNPIEKGIESKVQWQHSNLALEFAIDEGFEFEQEVPLHELPKEKRGYVLSRQDGAEKIIVEEVFGVNKHGFEAYYYTANKLVKKIEFD